MRNLKVLLFSSLASLTFLFGADKPWTKIDADLKTDRLQALVKAYDNSGPDFVEIQKELFENILKSPGLPRGLTPAKVPSVVEGTDTRVLLYREFTDPRGNRISIRLSIFLYEDRSVENYAVSFKND